MIVQLYSVNTRGEIERQMKTNKTVHQLSTAILLNPDPEFRTCGRVENVFFSPLPSPPRS